MSKIWTVLSGELTQGLHLNTNGKVTGTPRELVSSVIIARVTDSESGLFNDREIRVDFGQSIQDLAISTASIPHSHVDVPYSYTLGATGGAVPYKWEITSGEIPAGINLSRNGIISGTSLTSYLTPVVIQVEDRYGSTESSVFNLQSVVTMAFQTQSIANGYEQAEYIQPVIMTGGYQNQYEISAGSLPTGLMINNSTGSITGTPTIQGNYTFTVRCYDSLGHDVTREFTVSIYAEQDEAEVIILEPIEMTEPVSSSLLTEATEYSNYTYTLSVTGGTAPYIWTLISGSLPTGLNLHSSGIISGIPSGQGLVTFTLRATDSADPAATDDQVCSIQVNENPRYRTVNGITAGSVVIDTPAGEYILINPSLFARKLYTNSPVLGTPTGVFIRIMRYLTADNYTLSAPVLGQPAGEYHLITRNLSATGITTGAAILGSPVCIRPNDILVASSLSTGSPVIGSPVMVRRVNLTTSGITTGIPVLTNVIAHTLYTLNSVSLTCGAVILPSVTCGTGYPLSAQSITTGAVVFAAVSAGTTYSFTATQLTTGAVIIQTPLAHTSYSLNTGNMACGNVVIGTPAAGTGYSLSASVLTGGIPVIGSPSLETSYSVTPTAVVAGSVVLGTPVPHTSYEMSATIITTGQIVTGNPVLSEGQILYAVDLATGQFVLGTPQLVHHVSMTANNLIIGQPVMGSPQMTRIIALTANGLAASSPVLGSPVLDIPILITATGQYFSPILQVADGATVQWTFSDGTTSSSLTNDIDFGTNATRTHQLKVTPWSALQDLNLRYCGGDGGSSTEPNSAYTPTHGLNYDSPLLSRVVNILNLNLVQTNLQVLCISYCTMTSLDVSGFSHLWRLESYLGSLETVNFDGCVAMRRLCLEQNHVTALDISDCSLLEDIRGAGNAMPTIIWPETAIHLWHECLVSNGQFTPNIRIDFPNVQELWVSACNLQGNIVIPSQKLRSTWLYFNNLDSVDFSSARLLSGANIEASSSSIETVIFGPGCSALDEIDFRNNNLTAITGLQYLTAARRFRLDNNDFSTAQIDEILKHVDTIVHQTYNNDPGEWYNTRVTLTGNNPPSPDGMEHLNSLIAKGWYVTYDAPIADINLVLPHISLGTPYMSINESLLPIPESLVSFYPCDETSGNILHDSLGRRNLTLYNSMPWDVPGHNKASCWTPSHGGTTTLIDENLFLDGGTIAFWAYFLPSVGAIIHWPADWNNYHIYYYNGELAGCGNGWELGSSVGWVHVAIVFQTGQNLCYRNGELVYVLDDGPGRNRITNPFNLLSTANNANVFPAYVSDLHIWDKPCTHQEVLNCMNALYQYDIPVPSGLVCGAPVLDIPVMTNLSPMAIGITFGEPVLGIPVMINLSFTMPAELVSIYKCDETSGNVLHDTLNRWDRTLINTPAWTEDGRGDYTSGWYSRSNNAFSDPVDPPTGYNFDNGITMAFWASVLSLGNLGAIFRMTENQFHFTINNGYIGLNGAQTWQDTQLQVGDWHHIAISYSDTITGTVYLDGIVLGTFSPRAVSNFVFGAFSGGYAYPAIVNDIHIWNKVCTPTEIQNCMDQVYINGGSPASTPLSLATGNPVLGTPIMGIVTNSYVRIIDHTNFDDTSSQEDINLARQIDMYFEHASVGGNVINGLLELESNTPIFNITTGTVTRSDPTWFGTNEGIGEINRGNPGEYEKIDYFNGSITAQLMAAVDVATHKFCYIDTPVSATDLMAAAQTSYEGWEALYPNVIFVWWTMPITSSGAQAQRDIYNDLVRQYCQENNKFLFDIADIEAHDPSGVEQLDGNGYQLLYAPYTDDGGHLNATGRVRVARAMWTLLTNIRKFQVSMTSHPINLVIGDVILGSPELSINSALPENLISIYQCNQTSGTTLVDMLGNWDRVLAAAPDWNVDGYGEYANGWNPFATPSAWSPADADFPVGITFPNGLTIALWVYPVSYNVGAVYNQGYHLTLNSCRIGYGGGQTWGDDGLIPINAWSHIAFTISVEETVAYINGVQIGTTSGTTILPFALGAYNNDFRFPAIMNDVHIWNKVCTQTEIQNCMNQIYINGESPVSLTADNLVIGIPVLGIPTMENLTPYPVSLITGNVVLDTPVMTNLSVTIPDGLISIYKCDEGTGTTLNDSLGRMNLTLTGTVRWDNTGKDLDHCWRPRHGDFGVGSSARVEDSASYSNGMTISFWAYMDDGETGAVYSDDAGWHIYRSSNNITVYGYNDLSRTIPMGRWIHITITMSGTRVNFYVDAESIGGYDLTYSPPSTYTLGRYGSYYFPALMNNIHIWNKVCTVEEIQNCMNNTYLDLVEDLTISRYNMPNSIITTPYSESFQAYGGQAPYTWTLVSGNLPDGLSLNSNGTISGTPTFVGRYNYTVRVTDSLSAYVDHEIKHIVSPHQNLVSLYKCNETSGNTIYDELNHQNVVMGASPTWAIDGYGDYTSCWSPREETGNSAMFLIDRDSYGSDFTIAFWAYFTTTEDGCIIHDYVYDWALIHGGNNIAGVAGYPVGEWIHVAITCSSESTVFYANGSIVGTLGGRAYSGFSTFGSYDGSYEFPARMNDIHMWNKQCTIEEVQNCMNQSYVHTTSMLTSVSLVIGTPVPGMPVLSEITESLQKYVMILK